MWLLRAPPWELTQVSLLGDEGPCGEKSQLSEFEPDPPAPDALAQTRREIEPT